MIRTSPEYKYYLKYIYEDLQIRNCDFFKEWEVEEVDMEFHHILFLADLVILQGTLMLCNLKEGEFLTTFDIAKEVILLHFEDLVPGIILSTTIHQAFHAGLYTLNKDSKSLNLGNYKEFVKRFGKFLTEKDIDTITYFLDEPRKQELLQLWQKLEYRK